MTTPANMPSWMRECSTPSSHMPEAAWLKELRLQQQAMFLEHGLPTQHDERWKYTDLSFLNKLICASAQNTHRPLDNMSTLINQYRIKHHDTILFVFINGHYVPYLSDIKKLPAKARATSLLMALKENENTIKAHWHVFNDTVHRPFASMNAAAFSDGLFLQLPKHHALLTPVHLLSFSTTEHVSIEQPRHLILLGEYSQLTLIEEYAALPTHSNITHVTNTVTAIQLNEAAQLRHCKIQHACPHALHTAHTFIHQYKNSRLHYTNFSKEATFSRNDLVIKLNEAGAECKMAGFYELTQDGQYCDNHLEIDHIAPYCKSEMLYKGMLDKKSRAVFNGRLHVIQDAQKTSAYQANHNIVLSPQAEVYTKPELEIYANDVQCKHGATVGQLSEDALFYMQSRGIIKTDAIAILLQGFSEEIVQGIEDPITKSHVQERVK